MTLSRRLLLTLSIALVALVLVGSLGLWRLSQAHVEGAKSVLMAGAVHDTRATLAGGLDTHVAYKVKLGHDLRDLNNTAYSQAFWVLVSCMVVALAVSGGLGLQLYRLITAGLNNIQRTLQQVSQSLDLTHTAKVERMDEIGHTATAFNALLARVAEVVGEVRHSAGSVSVASRQIATGNTDLSQRTEELKIAETGQAASRETAPMSKPRPPAAKIRIAPRLVPTKPETTQAASTERNDPVATNTGAVDWETF
jgi:methyl-accepting chemotaxis protein